MKKGILLIGICITILIACDVTEPPVYGCTDEVALNFNPEANLDDESCVVIGCMDETAFNFIATANIACDSINPSNDCCCYSNFNCFENTSNIVQKALIEDFTGHKCQNCPEATEELHSLQDYYGNQVIGIAIHAGFFAEPNPVEAPYLTTDFRTEKGTEIHDFFRANAYPIGMVNRVDYNSNDDHLKSYQNWGSEVVSIVTQSPKMGICINESCETISVNLLALENLNYPLRLVVTITEDHIIDWQTIEGEGNVPDYEHNHVLRNVLTPALGDSIGVFEANEIKSYSFSYTLDSEWVKSNCNIVAYVLNQNTEEIVQVEEINIE